MRNFISFYLLLFPLFLSAQTYCFVNDGLKIQTKVSFQVQNNQVLKGRWETWDYSADSPQVSLFTGTKQGTKLRIKFTDGVIPYEKPPPKYNTDWTLGPEQLSVPAIQRNYETNRYEMTPIPFERCVVKK